ncbi:mannitol dehydrogenase family protein [Oleiagrimonas sp. C23AA]|uniref:mannitol dehydrogenase family protein n=1 Tax=Oleiagrimonas sp. C23AA TaxID=2719047 RepID=UPI0014247899|nr:mannitol dehydrogenase family protein [Oleiagrimonas sp. C23AA]NII11843.1 mannitol dehydrogenase family protein [Oleiagrimonas sp. C23AA]
MGLGAFHRAHQVWYTDTCSQAWGIAAFTGRRPVVAQRLSAQDGLYTLVERGPEGDSARIITSLVEAADGADMTRFGSLLASSQTAVVTLTVTEAGYHLTPDGSLDMHSPAIQADLAALRSDVAEPRTAPGRLVLGMRQRMRHGGGPLAVVPCDNLPDNGRHVAKALATLGDSVDQGLGRWIEQQVSCVSTSVDRITPSISDKEKVRLGAMHGWRDTAVVVTEPFHDWVLCGQFPAGRPPWEFAGARFVDDIGPFERRKLWLLNGAHSLLACAGPLLGHDTVAQAISDPHLRGLVQAFWGEASRHLPADAVNTTGYCGALIQRFSNERICHALDQIGRDSLTKLQVRVVPVAEAERAIGREAGACARVIACWIALWCRRMASPDAREAAIRAAMATPGDAVSALIDLVSPHLARDAAFTHQVRQVLALLPSVSGFRS